MTWNLTDDDVRKSITDTVAPPSEPADLFADDMWGDIFSRWATDNGFSNGNYDGSHFFDLWRDFHYGTGYEAMRDKYVADGNEYQLEWPYAVNDRFDRADAGMDDQAATLTELWNAAVEKFEPCLTEFFNDINEIQSEAASDPVVQPMKIDYDMIDRVNGANVKALKEGQYVMGYLWNTLLVLGDGHPDSLMDYVKSGGVKVRVYMHKKAGPFGPGELRWASVMDRPVPYDETEGIYEAVARFSEKKLRHT